MREEKYFWGATCYELTICKVSRRRGRSLFDPIFGIKLKKNCLTKNEVFLRKNSASEFDECCLLSLKREEWVNNQQKHCMNATISELKRTEHIIWKKKKIEEEFEYFLSSKPNFISYLSKILFFCCVFDGGEKCSPWFFYYLIDTWYCYVISLHNIKILIQTIHCWIQ